MRNRLALASGAFLFTLAAFGCGAGNNEVTASDETAPSALEDDEEKSEDKADKANESTAATSDSNTATTPAAPTGTSDPMPASPKSPPGTTPPPVVPTPPPVTGPVACASGGVREAEGNETPETATDLGASLSFCGSLSAATDVDHLSFILPADAKSFGWDGRFSSAGATITLTAEGVTKSTNETPPWFPGKKYVIRVSGTAALDYAVTMTIGR
jgi:hypothetical protein